MFLIKVVLIKKNVYTKCTEILIVGKYKMKSVFLEYNDLKHFYFSLTFTVIQNISYI